MIQGKVAAAGRESIRPYMLAWLIACAILVVANLSAISNFVIRDPDDMLRLLQVRDWLAGQSWFDVSQHRMNPPEGAGTHWSRLVDLPIAGLILLTRPLLGAANAELAALVAVPLLTLGVVMALVAAITRRLLDREQAIFASFVVPVTLIVTHQLRPLRIDHHGWQMALALAALLAALDTDRRRSGLVGGAALALWLSISLEGLPYAAAFAAVAAVRWLIDPRESQRLVWTLASLAGLAAALFAITRGLAWSLDHCDAVSPVHLAGLGIAAVGCALLTRWRSAALHWRIAGLGLAGAGALAAMAVLAPHCAAGPFEKLDPLVRDFWYLNIAEGLPLWTQEPVIVALVIALPLIGLAGSAVQFQNASGERRPAWAVMLFMLAAATIVAVFVQRAGAVANLFAIPGAVALFRLARQRIDGWRSAPMRLLGTLASLLLVAPSIAAALVNSAVEGEAAAASRRPSSCLDRRQIQALNRLPAGDVAAPLDLGLGILIHTDHRIVASGHHRNAAAMRDLFLIFLSPPQEARALLERRSIDWLIFCPAMPEGGHYKRAAPDGLWAQLDRGRIPAWLQPVELGGKPGLRVYRVTR
ncbi:MAG TPA: hypothetical protein VGD19_03360 [Allosphingosinicella sp.]|jgi:hypothetical protein